MPAAELPIPAVSQLEPIFRLARKPDSWCPPDWAFADEDGTFGNRFDDSEGYFRVLYASSTRLGCFIETLARFRRGPLDPDLDLSGPDADHIPRGTVPATWLTTRCMGQATIYDARFADVYNSQLVAYLRNQFEAELVKSEGTIKFDMAVLMSQRRWLSQQISTLVCSLGYDGIAYQSRHGSDLWNCAIFEPFVRLQRLGSSDLSIDDPDFQTALKRLDLVVDPTR